MTRPPRKRIDAFRTVLLRHGVPGLVLALICLWPDQPRASLQQSVELIGRQPELVAGIALVLLAVMVARQPPLFPFRHGPVTTLSQAPDT